MGKERWASRNTAPALRAAAPRPRWAAPPATTEYFRGYSSDYNALQVKLDHKFAGGFSITNSYAYSRALGYMSRSQRLS